MRRGTSKRQVTLVDTPRLPLGSHAKHGEDALHFMSADEVAPFPPYGAIGYVHPSTTWSR
ncbi:hypothetical protein GCM10022225_26400 [Plantactinospora mayteni]|uniref:Uncharacterized protein n=1 Tax=Plantactinospora mayteni TaxID=566021 RepID=A0ABQ4EIQ2_9ACTN|nr:hypothetical protein Pma05_12030 [Plantactinospora mayteni]